MQEETSSRIRIAAWVKEVEEKKKQGGRVGRKKAEIARYHINANIFIINDAEENMCWSLEPVNRSVNSYRVSNRCR